MSEPFLQKNSLATHIFFDLCLFKPFCPVANFEQQSICEIHCYLCPHIFWVYYFSLSQHEGGESRIRKSATQILLSPPLGKANQKPDISTYSYEVQQQIKQKHKGSGLQWQNWFFHLLYEFRCTDAKRLWYRLITLK